MSRAAQLVWPALVLVASFLAVFGISRALATEKVAPQPTATVTVTAPPVTNPAPGRWLTLTVTGGNPEVPGVLVTTDNQRCLDPNFSRVWGPDNGEVWSQVGTALCLKPADWTKTDLVLRFRGL